MFKNPFFFEGRIRRLEYGLSSTIYFIGYVFAGFFVDLYAGLSGTNQDDIPTIIILLLFIPLIWLMLAPGANRCHDKLVNQIAPNKAIWGEFNERFRYCQVNLNDLKIKFVALHREWF